MTELSIVAGESVSPLLEYTIGEALSRAAERWPEEPALISVHQGLRFSWRELAARADAFAAGLLALGLEKGDRVGVWAPNCAEWTIAQLGTARVGMIQVNINPAYRSHELAYTLMKAGVKFLICAARFKSSDYVGMMESLVPELPASAPGRLQSGEFPMLLGAASIGGVSRPGWLDFAEVPERAGAAELTRLREISARLDCHEPINIQFTSGTTGLPKGATLSHRNILNNAYFVGLIMGLRRGDKLCIPVPLYHCFGMVIGNLACLVHGATMVYPSEGFDPLAVLRAVEQEKCTALHGVPTMFIAELEHPEFDRFDLSSLRTGLMAGSPCPVEVMKKVRSRMHMTDVGIAYGMTETSPSSFQTSLDDPVERRVSTIGRVHPHVQVKIIDAAGATVPRGQPAELCTRGYSVMLGYWEDPGQTSEAIDSEGWMHTGDLATIDGAGYGNIVGRIKDMVIRGGENIFPREVEEYLHQHPKVLDVQVVGVPDPKWGEELCAWIRLRAGEIATEEEIRAFCAGQIAHYKVPRYVRFVDAFPMTVTGKVQKFQIRAAMIAELKIETLKTA